AQFLKTMHVGKVGARKITTHLTNRTGQSGFPLAKVGFGTDCNFQVVQNLSKQVYDAIPLILGLARSNRVGWFDESATNRLIAFRPYSSDFYRKRPGRSDNDLRWFDRGRNRSKQCGCTACGC